MNNPLRYSDPSGMLLEPLPNPGDAGYPYNPEAAAFLANCYGQFDSSYGSTGGGWGGFVIGADQDYVATVMNNSNVRFYGYSTSDGISYNNYTGKAVPYKRGDKRFGHWESVSSPDGGIISGNNKNNLNNPSNISEIMVAEKWIWDIPSNSDLAIRHFILNFTDSKMDRVGGYGGEMLNAISGSASLIGIAAEGLSIVKKITRGVSSATSVINLVVMLGEKPISKMSYGDKARLFYNGIIIGADAFAPGSGFVCGLLDTYGFFEYDYQQWDTYENTGYWVYYNMWTGKWKTIKK